MLAIGIDAALNHGMICALTDRQVSFAGLSQIKKDVRDTPHVIISRLSKDCRGAERLLTWYEFFSHTLGRLDPDNLCIEGYAFGAHQGAHQLGELGGVLRLALIKSNITYHEVSPSELKVFATGNGRADKSQMIETARQHIEIPSDLSLTLQGDMADAFWAAKFAQRI